MIPNCTLTTACFDLTKYNIHSRDLNRTIENISALLEVPCYLVIFTDNILFNFIKNKRDEYGFDNITHYIVIDIETLDSFKYRTTVTENRKKYHPTKDERTCPESHLVCSSKFELVLKTINLNPFNTLKFGWIDSNIGINFSKICTNYKNNMLLKVLNDCDNNKFNLQILNVCDKKYINEDNLKEYYFQYRWIVCGCLFITGKEIGTKILNELNNKFIRHTELGYGHGEEMYYLEILDKFYDDINRSYGDYNHILNNFNNITVGFDYVKNIAYLYMQYSYHRECIDCCNYVLSQYNKYNVEINYDIYFDLMFFKYISLYYYDNKEAKSHVLKILEEINKNPKIKTAYERNKEYYDAQFRYAL